MDPPKQSTSASRMRKFREKKKDDPDYKKKENERIKELQKKKRERMTKKELEDLRERKRNEKRQERERKKLQQIDLRRSNLLEVSTSNNSSSSIYPYKCVQTYSKAVLKCIKSLPSCPIKQKSVIEGVCTRLGIKLVKEIEKDLSENREFEFEQTVRDFYYRPDIVYTCPGMNDSMAVWENGKKQTLQKHYLTMFVKEAYCVFCEENPEFKICYSKFCSLRPANVLLLKDTPAEQCKCKLHENFIMKLRGLEIAYSNKFWKDVLCDDKLTSECWNNKCDNCGNLKKLDKPNNLTKTVYWKEWVKLDNNKIKIKVNETSAGELYDKIILCSEFVRHVHLKRIQSEEFNSDKKRENTRILQVDFAMSYSCEYQNEIQSALWARSSVTLFTAAVFFKNECQTFVICSDCPNKNKDTVFVFMNHLYNIIISENNDTNINDVIWSDGPSSEFKNKFMVHFLHYLSKKHNKKFLWKYFATSHGKGVIDGVGGNVKRLVRQKTMSQRRDSTVVQTAEEFATLASSLVPNTKILYISQAEIEAEIVQKRPWEKVNAIAGISRFHVLKCDGEVIRGQRHALDTQEAVFRPKNTKFIF